MNAIESEVKTETDAIAVYQEAAGKTAMPWERRCSFRSWRMSSIPMIDGGTPWA